MSGEPRDGTPFEGTDTIRVIATEENDLIKEWMGKFNDYYTKTPTIERYEVSAQS